MTAEYTIPCGSMLASESVAKEFQTLLTKAACFVLSVLFGYGFVALCSLRLCGEFPLVREISFLLCCGFRPPSLERNLTI
jgi:hypothetical protein